ncbi:MAG: ABC transporter permease [Deltaproteobacteria bacterium]|nr:ABC transporter permease [Deltaproteobacteria bacterium]
MGRATISRALHFALPLLLLVVVWELAARLNLINTLLFPAPSTILATYYHLLLPGDRGYSALATHLARSLFRVASGFVLGFALGITLGIALGVNRTVFWFLSPILGGLMPIPSIAWTPILMIWLGLDDRTVIAVVAIATSYPILLNTMTGVRGVSRYHVWAMESMGASPAQILLRVIFPGALAYILTGCKLGFASAWRSLVGAEMIAATGWGLGYMIFESREFMLTDITYGGLAIISVIALGIETGILNRIERVTVGRWGMLTEA